MKQPKPRIPTGGKPLPALTKLKQLKVDSRRQIMDWLRAMPYAEVPAVVEEKFAVKCGVTSLHSFWDWQQAQDRLENYNRWIEGFQEFYAKQHPDASRERIREMGIAYFMSEAAANNDRKGFIGVAALSLKEDAGKRQSEALEFDKEKFREALKDSIVRALDALFAEIKDNPKAMDLFEKFRTAVKGAVQ